jgi:hypothetical protein
VMSDFLITPRVDPGIGQWTDGEKIRATGDGVGREGTRYSHDPLPGFPLDGRRRRRVASSLTPVRSPIPKTRLRFVPGLTIQVVLQPSGKVRSRVATSESAW